MSDDALDGAVEIAALRARLSDWEGDKPTPCRHATNDRCATILACHITCQRFVGTLTDRVKALNDFASRARAEEREWCALEAFRQTSNYLPLEACERIATAIRKLS
jgi:hypothetical protein